MTKKSGKPSEKRVEQARLEDKIAEEKTEGLLAALLKLLEARKSGHFPVFLKSLDEKLKNADPKEAREPKDEVQEGYHVVGELSDNLRRIWVLRQQIHNQMVGVQQEGFRALAEINTEFDRQKLKPIAQKGGELNEEYVTLWNIFICSLRAEYPELVGKEVIGCAKGWKVYWTTQADLGIVAVEVRSKEVDLLESFIKGAGVKIG